MSAIADRPSPADVNARLVALVASWAVATAVFLCGFVVNEPAPYELFMVVLIPVWALFGLRISASIVPLLVLLVLFNIGGLVAMTQLADLRDTPLYLAVSLFLAFTAVFFAAVLEARPNLYRLIFGAWVASAVCTGLLGILGYFNAFPGAETFTRFDRASGAFKDPNVFGPFLTVPAIYLLYRLITGRASTFLIHALPLLVLVCGILLSFSRGAWGLFGFSAAILVGALFLQSSSGLFRLRVAMMSAVALAVLGVAVLVALQFPQVSELFTSRAQLVQEYDGARLGRFARYGLGFQMAMENPLGIGPLAFGRIFGEDTHNVWLKALLDYSWLGFAAYVTLVAWTLAAGLRILFRDRPWQPYFMTAYIVFVGHVALGTFIDMDHWRHFYLLLGMLWGGIALERRHQAALRGRNAHPAAPAPGPAAL